MYLVPQGVLNPADDVGVAGCDEGDCLALLLRPCGPAHAMNIVVGIAGNIVVDDMRDVAHIDHRQSHDSAMCTSSWL